MNNNQRGQVWIETMIYTLISFAVIGLVLAVALPRIQEAQDKAIIEQSIGLLEGIDDRILSSIQGGTGNKRVLEILIKKGKLTIDSPNDLLIFELESRHKYSEPGKDVQVGGISVLTTPKGKFNTVALTMDYSESIDIRYGDSEDNDAVVKVMSQSSNPYSFSMLNKGQEEKENFYF